MGRSGLDLGRSSGVLLHVSSLPGRGIGDLGEAAYRWVDWLAEAGQSYWQILPLVPVGEDGSPYHGLSALAGNALLVSPDRLVGDGLLRADEVYGEGFPVDRVEFEGVAKWKNRLLRRAFDSFREGAASHLQPQLDAFRSHNAYWLHDYALFRALLDHFGGASWQSWEMPLRLREPAALREWRDRLSLRVEDHVFRQFLFDRQWSALRDYAKAAGIRIIGDIPIFVSLDSADVWAHRELFWLDENGQPIFVSGVPPDYFSETGQLWGNPLYRWDVMERRGYDWWVQRFRRTLEQVDVVRLDHFRGFEAYWEVPAGETTALRGRWAPGPGAGLFHALERELGPLPIIAEDLGLITPQVDELRDGLGFPGMRVLQFAYDGDRENPHRPENHPRNAVAYTGTHDNATALGWWREASPEEHAQLEERGTVSREGPHRDLIRRVFESPAALAVVPLQDVLGLGDEARMNTPGTVQGNWSWRVEPHLLTAEARSMLREITRATGRLCTAPVDSAANPST